MAKGEREVELTVSLRFSLPSTLSLLDPQSNSGKHSPLLYLSQQLRVARPGEEGYMVVAIQTRGKREWFSSESR